MTMDYLDPFREAARATDLQRVDRDRIWNRFESKALGSQPSVSPSPRLKRRSRVLAIAAAITISAGGAALASSHVDLFSSTDAGDQVASVRDPDPDTEPMSKQMAAFLGRLEARTGIAFSSPTHVIATPSPKVPVEVVAARARAGGVCFALIGPAIGETYRCERSFSPQHPATTQLIVTDEVSVVVGLASDAVKSVTISDSTRTAIPATLRSGVIFAELGSPPDSTVTVTYRLLDGNSAIEDLYVHSTD